MYDVTARVKKKDVNYRIPIPEGFLFLTFAESGEIQDVYYFPNFIDYEALKAHQPNYKHFPALFRLPNLSQLFLVPEVTLGLVEEHQKKLTWPRALLTKYYYSRLLSLVNFPKSRCHQKHALHCLQHY